MSSVWFQGLLGPSQPLAFLRKPLNFQNLPEHLDQLLQVDSEDEESQGMWQLLQWDWRAWGAAMTRSRGALCALSPDPVCRPTPHLPFPSAGQVEGRLGPSTVVLDHTGGFEGLLLVDDDLLGVSEGKAWDLRPKLLLTALSSS